MTENREQGGPMQMVQRIVTPFACRDACAVGGQYLAEFGSGEIKLASKFFWNGHARHVRLSPAFLLDVLRLVVMLGHLDPGCQPAPLSGNALDDVAGVQVTL